MARGGYIITASGRKFHPLTPVVEEVYLEDIASHLSKQARWTGATKGDKTYSIAQHSVMVSLYCELITSDPVIALDGLHHDSSEVYLVDVARPVKYTPGFMEIYRRYEKALNVVIYDKFNLPWDGDHHPIVKDADNRMLATEARDVMPEPVDGYGVYEFDINTAYSQKIKNIWSPKKAREIFIARHNLLTSRRTDLVTA